VAPSDSYIPALLPIPPRLFQMLRETFAGLLKQSFRDFLTACKAILDRQSQIIKVDPTLALRLFTNVAKASTTSRLFLY
jgi:hypothetical protein